MEATPGSTVACRKTNVTMIKFQFAPPRPSIDGTSCRRARNANRKAAPFRKATFGGFQRERKVSSDGGEQVERRPRDGHGAGGLFSPAPLLIDEHIQLRKKTADILLGVVEDAAGPAALGMASFVVG